MQVEDLSGVLQNSARLINCFQGQNASCEALNQRILLENNIKMLYSLKGRKIKFSTELKFENNSNLEALIDRAGEILTKVENGNGNRKSMNSWDISKQILKDVCQTPWHVVLRNFGIKVCKVFLIPQSEIFL